MTERIRNVSHYFYGWDGKMQSTFLIKKKKKLQKEGCKIVKVLSTVKL